MSVNIMIRAGGEEKFFSAMELQTELRNGGVQVWIPKGDDIEPEPEPTPEPEPSPSSDGNTFTDHGRANIIYVTQHVAFIPMIYVG